MDQIIQQLTDTIQSLADKITSLEQKITRIEIDSQFYLMRKGDLQQGYGTKVMYDRFGLIVGSTKLEEKDIPQLSVSKIEGLSEVLDNLVSAKDVNSLKSTVDELTNGTDVIDTFTKVNVDKHGLIRSGGKLIKEDIPEITIDHVTGLSKSIELINQKLESLSESVTRTETRIDQLKQAGGGSNYTLNKPDQYQSSIEQSIAELQQAVMLINQRLNRRDSYWKNLIQVPAGRYSGFTVNDNGQLISAEKFSGADIDTIHAKLTELSEQTTSLQQSMISKSSHSDVIELKNRINQLFSELPDIKLISNAAKLISDTANELSGIQLSIKELQSTISDKE